MGLINFFTEGRTPKGKIGYVKNLFSKIVGNDEFKAKAEDYETIYKVVPLVQAAINYTADLAVGTGYKLISEDKEQLKLVDEFLQDQNITLIAHQICRHMLTYGNAFTEIVGIGKNLTELRVLHPKAMDVSVDNSGNPVGYIQDLGYGKQISFDLEEMAHFKWNVIGDNVMGSSTIEAIRGVLNIKLKMEQTLNLITRRYAAPQILYQFGNDNVSPTDDQITQFKNDLDKHHPEMDFVVPWWIDAKAINPIQNRIGVEEFLKHIENQVIAGLQVPEVALGRGQNSTEATAKVQQAIFDRRVKALQRVLISQFERLVIDRITNEPGVVKIEFGEFIPEDEDLKVNRLLRLKSAGIVTADYVAGQLGIPAKFVPEEPAPEENKGNKGNSLNIKGVDPNKKDVRPKKAPVETVYSDDRGTVKIKKWEEKYGSSI